MGKTSIKKRVRKEQNDCYTVKGKALPKEDWKIDKHRPIPKAEGGIYTDENTSLLDPVEHMKHHGNLRIRTEDLDRLKALVDDREQVMKLRNKIANQLRAYERRTDNLSDFTKKYLGDLLVDVDDKLKICSRSVEKIIKELSTIDGLIASALGVVGIGPMTVAYLTVYVDLEKARHASSLWSYAGLHKASHERYEKGTSGGGNKTLRTVLWNTATSIEKNRKSPYRDVYDRTKARLEISEKMVKSRNTQGKLIECSWKDTKPCHRQGAAKRKVMKHVLADYWLIGRQFNGLSTNPLYAEAILGMDGHRTVDPVTRGWKLPEG